LCNELRNYSDSLLEKPRIVLCNKIDEEGAFEHAVEVVDKIRATEPDTVVIPVSVMMGRGMKEAQNSIVKLVNKQECRIEAEEKGTDQFGSGFMKDRAYIDDDDDNVQYPGSEQ
jgi:GTP-binding protein